MPGRPLRLILWTTLLAAPASAGVVTVVPAFETPLAPTPVVMQLALDMASVSPGGPASLTLSPALPVTPAVWANLSAVTQGVTPAAPAIPALAAAPAGRAVAPAGVVAPFKPALETGALARLQIAQDLLGRYEPGAFAKLDAAGRDAALAALWDGWKAKGLVAEPGGPEAVDALVLAGVDDKALTAANKSVFLGVAMLGYPLQDALWLARTRIRDAIEENTLRYPEGQKWHTADHTPEFLGVSPQAQGFVDAWGAATSYAKQIVAQVKAGSTVLPRSAAASPAAAAAFARVVAELKAHGDGEAVAYLAGQDPTFTAFLLDARKPGYYLYNGDGSVVARIMETKAARALGIRRVLHPVDGLNVSSTYFYRPRRVLDRLREIHDEPGGPHSDNEKALLAAYEKKLEPLVGGPSVDAPPAPYSFADPDSLPGSALDSPKNALSSYPQTAATRWDLPLPAASLRARFASGDRHPSLDEARWKALGLLLKASKLSSWDGDARFVSERWQTRDRLVAPSKDGKSVLLQLALLDEIDRLSRGDKKTLASFLRFAGAAVDGALIY